MVVVVVVVVVVVRCVCVCVCVCVNREDQYARVMRRMMNEREPRCLTTEVQVYVGDSKIVSNCPKF